MKKKGFTLVELLAVLIILGLLSTIIVPKITQALKKSKNSAYNIQIEAIKKATKDWALANLDCLVENGTTSLTLGRLKYGNNYDDSLNCENDKGGFIDEKIKNPKTDELFDDDLKISVVNEGNSYTYIVEDVK